MAEPTEAEFQAQVLQLAALYGWRHLHVRKSVGRRAGGRGWQTTTNIDGWPDLLLWHVGQQRRLAVELKAKRGKPTDAQLAVLAELQASGMVEAALVVYPADLDTLHALLRRPVPG